MRADRRLIINADDYGHCREVNDAVEQLDQAGLLGGVSVLAAGAGVAQAIEYLRARARLAAGIHLNAVEGPPLSAAAAPILEAGRFPRLPKLMLRWMLRPRDVARAVETEWRAQIERLLEAGIRLHHADSHQHLHAFPPAFECAVRLCREYGIPAIRMPNEHLRDRRRFAGALGVRTSLALAQFTVSTRGLRRNDHFLGFRQAGHYTLQTLLADIASLPAGLTELAVHPSTRDGVPYLAYKSDRERAALLDPTFRDGLRDLGVKPVSWLNA
ncbi:MAG: carbohydrate deacetylase [Blastocatellia bacterium]